MPWGLLFAGLVTILEMQRTALIADLGHAVPQGGRDGSISPDVAALAGIRTLVPPRLAPHPVKHDEPRALPVGSLCAWAAHFHDERHQGDQCDDNNNPPEHRNHPSREVLVDLSPIWL